MIGGLLLIAFGALGIALSLLEMVSSVIDSGHAFWTTVRRLAGRGSEPMSQLQAAMVWVQAIGLLLGGCVFIYAGLSVWE